MSESSGYSDYFNGAGSYDRETVQFFDVAHEGAQLRAVAQAAGSVSHLSGLNPRSVVVLATDQVAAAAARAVLAWHAPLEVPVMVTRTLPNFVGALDVVVVVGDAAGRESDSRALITAANRGAATVLAGPSQGPLLDDAPGTTSVIPSLPTAAGPSPARTIAVVDLVLRTLAGEQEVAAERLELLAREVDQEIEAVTPERDETVNAARQLRGFTAGARVLHTGIGAHDGAVAELAAVVWSTRGIPSAFVAADELAGAVERARPAGRPAADDIFHDPYLDGPAELVGLKTIVWACGNAGDIPDAVSPASRVESAVTESQDPAAAALRLLGRAYAATALADPTA